MNLSEASFPEHNQKIEVSRSNNIFLIYLSIEILFYSSLVYLSHLFKTFKLNFQTFHHYLIIWKIILLMKNCHRLKQSSYIKLVQLRLWLFRQKKYLLGDKHSGIWIN